MGLAAGLAPNFPQVLAGDVQSGVHQQIPLPDMQPAEIDLGGVAQEPGRLVIKGLRSLLNPADPEGDVERPALSAERLAGWRRRHGGPD
jgi:hypothetical protein